MSSELTILLLNTVLIAVCYLFLYPRWVGNSLSSMMFNDVIATLTALIVAGNIFAGSGQEFSLLFLTVNWFWFTLVSYTLMELPLAVLYMRRRNMIN